MIKRNGSHNKDIEGDGSVPVRNESVDMVILGMKKYRLGNDQLLMKTIERKHVFQLSIHHIPGDFPISFTNFAVFRFSLG